MSAAYVGRFAPSPTGPLHFGSLVAAVASHVDARAQSGAWLLRIEDVDTARCDRSHEKTILAQLDAYGFVIDGTVARQSERGAHYRNALAVLQSNALTYRCQCSRKSLADARRNVDGEIIYPGHCREKNLAENLPNTAIRLNLHTVEESTHITFNDRGAGAQSQNVCEEVGDFVLLRADGDFAYQLAVVVDDALQGVTDVVRGADLLGNTARQIVLQRALGYLTPRYLHVPIATNADGEKLSKQTKAAALPQDAQQIVETLQEAWVFLKQEPLKIADVRGFWRAAVANWQPDRLSALQNAGATANL